MKASNHDRLAVLLCAALIVVMYVIDEPVGIILFAIFGLYFAFKN